MMSLNDLPEFFLSESGELARSFRTLGIEGYRAAARYVRDLPYGRNSDRSDYRLVLYEGRGTCSTKHALLAALAREHGVAVELRIGVYLMDGTNTPGVARVLRRHGIRALPEAHCYLAHRDRRVDVTGVEGSAAEEFIHEETIEPAQIGTYKAERHRKFVRRWASERGLDAGRVWQVREECIGALSSQGAISETAGG